MSLSTSYSGAKFHVAICGTGIAGLVLAITIGKYNPLIPIDLYEANEAIEAPDVGITLAKLEGLTELGLLDDLQPIFMRDPENRHGLNMRRSDMPEGGYPWLQITHRSVIYAAHCQSIVDVLERHLPASCTMHFRKRLVGYEEPGRDANPTSPIRLEFEDGTCATTDVLIGADGIDSAVRRMMFEKESKGRTTGHKTDLMQYAEATFTGTIIYRLLIPADAPRKESPGNLSLRERMSYQGKGQRLVTYPVSNGTMINCSACLADPSLIGTQYEGHWVSEATREEVVGHFENFEPDARAVIKRFDTPSKWALHVVKPLPFCVRKRVAIIGDACHGMTPTFGSGGGQAIEDAFVLGRLIAHPLTTLSRIPTVLRIYQDARLPVVRELSKLSFSTMWMQVFMKPGYYDGTRKEDDRPVDDAGVGACEREGMDAIKRENKRRWDWVEGLKGELETWKEAEVKLRALVAPRVNRSYTIQCKL